jgi:hypothetical protein
MPSPELTADATATRHRRTSTTPTIDDVRDIILDGTRVLMAIAAR